LASCIEIQNTIGEKIFPWQKKQFVDLLKMLDSKVESP